MKPVFAGIAVMLMGSMLTWGQRPPDRPGRRGDGPPPPAMGQDGGRPRGPGGKWWDNPDMARRIGITPEQQKKMDDVFQQSRLRLIDLHAALEKEQVMLDGLMRGPQLDDSKILPAVDRIAQARAELEKADVRLLLGIRHVLTPEQWSKLDSERPRGPRSQGPPNGGQPNNGPPPRE